MWILFFIFEYRIHIYIPLIIITMYLGWIFYDIQILRIVYSRQDFIQILYTLCLLFIPVYICHLHVFINFLPMQNWIGTWFMGSVYYLFIFICVITTYIFLFFNLIKTLKIDIIYPSWSINGMKCMILSSIIMICSSISILISYIINNSSWVQEFHSIFFASEWGLWGFNWSFLLLRINFIILGVMILNFIYWRIQYNKNKLIYTAVQKLSRWNKWLVFLDCLIIFGFLFSLVIWALMSMPVRG